MEHTPSTSFDDIEDLGEVDLNNNAEECCYEPVDYSQWSHHNIEDWGEVCLYNSSDLNHMD